MPEILNLIHGQLTRQVPSLSSYFLQWRRMLLPSYWMWCGQLKTAAVGRGDLDLIQNRSIYRSRSIIYGLDLLIGSDES